MSPGDRKADPPRRHPSAGNLDARPELVLDGPVESVSFAAFPHGGHPPTRDIALGPDLPGEAITRLLGHVDGRRVLELGCGTGDLAIQLALAGARVIALDSSSDRIADARDAAEVAGVKVEFHHGDLADLAFVRNDQVDLAISVYALAAVADLDRAFRQVHRVLRSEAQFVLSLPHPLALVTEMTDADPAPRLARSYFDAATVPWSTETDRGESHVHRLGEVITSMARSNFRVDAVTEPRPVQETDSVYWSPAAEWVPTTVVVRGRKLGS